eukprot:TRINITY_DN7623_c0_g1_i4.p1 TRINITY_DN7623_c0_g1~~TRINITY_DN7623_c0_g1_i4.p1  ORF type:complete len:232 (+),score=40.70 TRINITY_DN7623_c0_g1_i4:24-698(+)
MSVDKPVATDRAAYRAGRKETAVRAYAVTKESRYLVIRNVPQLGTTTELLKLLSLYGQIEEWRHLDDEETPEYTEAYWVKYKQIGDARFSKRKLDDHEFYHHLLDVSYSHEDETEEDVHYKLEERRRAVINKALGRKRRIVDGDLEQDAPAPVLDGVDFPDMGPADRTLHSSSSTTTTSSSSTSSSLSSPEEVPPTSHVPARPRFRNESVNSTVMNIRNKLKRI